MRRILPFLSLLLAACSTSGAVLSANDGGTSCNGPECCTTNKQCQDRNGGQTFICRKTDHVCVNLLSAECPKVLADPGDLANDATVVIGHIGMPSAAAALHDEENAVELARRDLAVVTHGLRPATPDGPPRPLAIIACDSTMGGVSAEHDGAIRAAKHLAEDVRVPAIVSTNIGTTGIDVAQTVAIPNHVLAITTSTTAPSLSTLNDDDLVWRIAPTDVRALAILPTLVAQLEVKASATHSPPTKVAILGESTTPAGVLDTIRLNVKVNTKSLADNGANVASFDVTGVGQENSPGPTNVVASLVAFQPAIVLYAIHGSEKVLGQTLSAIETQWPSGSPRPFHIGVLPGWTAALQAKLAGDVTVRSRAFAVDVEAPLRQADREAAFAVRMKAMFTDATSASAPLAGRSYDATLLLAFAVAASNGQPLTGKVLANGLRNVDIPGLSTFTGPSDLAAGFATIETGGKIDYRGVDGMMLFDPAGDRKYDANVVCSRPGGSGFGNSGLRVVGIGDEVEGTLACE